MRTRPSRRVLTVALAAALGALTLGPDETVGVSENPAITQTAAGQQRLRGELRRVHESQRNVGLAAAVMQGGRIVFSDAIGLADLEHETPVTPQTRFGVASVTKAFTGVALLRLWSEGKVDLGAPIQRHLPRFPSKPEGEITARLLAAHMAGIRHWEDERTPALYATIIEDVLEILPLFADDPLVFAPGSSYRYSSHGYNLLAALIQSASGQPFQAYVAESVLEPLELTATGFDDVQRVLPNRARRYSFYEPTTYAPDSTAVYRVPEWSYSHNMGGGNMYSTAEDLVRFGFALTEPGLLNAHALERLQSRIFGDDDGSPWSYGWFVTEPRPGVRRIHITGANPGVQAGLHVYPDHGLAVAVLSNTWGLGSQSGEMVVGLPERLAAITMGWTEISSEE